MHEVRVYQNRHEGTLWWGEDDRGFTGGADTLDELLAYVQEWAEAEGTLDVLAVRLVTTGHAVPAAGVLHLGCARGSRGVLLGPRVGKPQ